MAVTFIDLNAGSVKKPPAPTGNVAADTVALQAFFTDTSTTRYPAVDWDGEWTVDTEIVIGPAAGSNATKNYHGTCKIIADTTFTDDNVAKLQNCGSVIFDSIHLDGAGTASNWSARGAINGLYVETGSGRLNFRSISAESVQHAGLLVPSANSVSQFGQVKVTDCGSYTGVATSYALRSSWSNPVNNGTSNSTGQSTTIDVVTDLPTWIYTGTTGDAATTYASVNDAPIMVLINSEWYYVTAVNRPAGTINVFPWIDSAVVSGTLDYVFGGGVLLQGVDSNDHDFQGVDAIRCSQGLACSSLYIPNARRVVAQFCGVGISIGRTPSGAALGGDLSGYFENNTADILEISRQSSTGNNYCVFSSEWALDLTLLKNVSWPRDSSDNRDLDGNAFARTNFMIGGRNYRYDKKYHNRSGSSSSVSIVVDDAHPVHHHYDAGAVTAQLLLNKDEHELTGRDSIIMYFTGNGTNGQPGGIITMQAHADMGATTVNGVASITFDPADITGPLVLIARWDWATDDWLVYPFIPTQIDRGTSNVPFLNFRATADADATSAISTLTTSGTPTHHIQVEINGTKAWIPCSTTDPS